MDNLKQKDRGGNKLARRRRKNYLPQKGTNRYLNQKASFSTLSSLVGKKVKINRGGPGSKEGILLSTKKDYVALLTDQEVLYFITKHIHSITQNIKENSSDLKRENDTQLEYSNAETLSDMLKGLKYQSIQINNGHESRAGVLLNFNKDMIAVLSEEDGVIFYNMEHVKLIKKVSATDEGDDKEKNRTKIQLRTGSFSDIVKTFKQKWVSINRSGPEALEGVLIDVGGGFYTIVNNEEAIRIHSFHIKNISEGVKGSFKTLNNEKENQEQRYSNKNELQFSSELSDEDDCSCEDSVNDGDTLGGIIWNRSHEVKIYDVFN